MKNNFKILSMLLLSAMFFSCISSIPRTIGPYIAAEDRNLSKTQSQPQQQPPQQQTYAQTQPQPQQQQPSLQNNDVRNDIFSAVYASDTSRINTYNIVVGSFSVQDNAKRLAKSLQPNYNPIVVVNEKGMYRVIIASFDDYNVAKEELEKSVRYKFSDAWILAQKR